MNDDEHRDDPGEGAEDGQENPSGADTGEKGSSSGFGLTEEFARIEAEIEREISGRGADEEDPEAPEVETGPADDAEHGPQDTEADAEHPDADHAAKSEADDDAEEWVEAGSETVEAEAIAFDDTDEWQDWEGRPAGSETGEEPVAEGTEDSAEEPAEAAVEAADDTGDEEAVEDADETAAEPPADDTGDEEAVEGADDTAADPPAEDEGEEPPAEDEGEEKAAAHGSEQSDAPESEGEPHTEVVPAASPPAALRAGVHPVVTPMPRAMVPVAVAPEFTDEELEDTTPSLWWRFLTGSVLIVISMATATSVTALLFLSDVAAKLQPIPGIQERLAEINPGDPQTILILGSDKRPEDLTARSDTTMLLRVDPDSGVLSLFSLPRDLKVDVPGIGPTKLNEAYSAGGPELTLQTIKNLTGLEINHVVNVNFQGFADAVDAIDCVYVDVDRDYYHTNEGLYGAEQYSEIDINAGYQRLCGLKALEYVRYRHTDTDIVRAARQQDFLREARQKVQPKELLFNGAGNDLIDIFTKYTKSDVSEAAQVIGILKSFIAVKDVPVKEIHFEGSLGPSYVTASNEQIQKAVEQFLGGQDSAGPRGGPDADAKTTTEEPKPEKPKPDKPPADPRESANVIEADPQFAKYAGTASRRLNFEIFYPTRMVPGSAFDIGSRTYDYENSDNDREDAYKLVVAYTTPSTLTEYYGVMGTTWDDPPILNNPSETRAIDGHDYQLYYDGDRLRLVAWHEDGNAYWLSNTLVQTLGEAEMLSIATSMEKLQPQTDEKKKK